MPRAAPDDPIPLPVVWMHAMRWELRFEALPRERHYLGLRNFRRHRLSVIRKKSLFRELPTVASTHSSPMSFGRHRTKRLALS